MEYKELYEKYASLLTTLKNIIAQSNTRVLSDSSDDIFSGNVNFFVKSYLINICTYLEAYLKDVAFEYSTRVSRRLTEAKIPHNFIYSKFSKEIKERDLKYANSSVLYSKKDLSDIISGNPYKTINAFKLIGVDLNSSEKFLGHKSLIETIVNKRNNIIHHNDDASDISFTDLIVHIDIFLEYMTSIEEVMRELDI